MSRLGDWNAAQYDDQHSFVWKYGEDVLKLLAPQAGERVLDLGSGTGHLTAGIAAAGADVVGLDASPEMVAQARANHPTLQFVLGDAADFAFPPLALSPKATRGGESSVAGFDAVFSNATLHWVTRAADAAACIARALKPGGRLVAELGGKGNIAAIVEAIAAARADGGFPSRPAEGIWYFPSVGEYAALLEQHGLSVTFAHLFDRPTPLEGGERGLHDWIRMFAIRLLEDLPADRQPDVIRGVEDLLRATRFKDGTWVADYRRLRIVAVRE